MCQSSLLTDPAPSTATVDSPTAEIDLHRWRHASDGIYRKTASVFAAFSSASAVAVSPPLLAACSCTAHSAHCTVHIADPCNASRSRLFQPHPEPASCSTTNLRCRSTRLTAHSAFACVSVCCVNSTFRLIQLSPVARVEQRLSNFASRTLPRAEFLLSAMNSAVASASSRIRLLRRASKCGLTCLTLCNSSS